MKAVIMAGGFGTRLRPLTNNVPKPMIPMANKPMMEHIVDLLCRHGITDLVTLLHFQPELIEAHFRDGSAFGVTMAYVSATEDFGTAGAVKNAEAHLGGPCLVISGDVLTDFDLGAAIAFHQDRRADLTILLTRVENPLQYGVVVAEPDGRISRFLEKPTWSEVFSDTVNTGIYVLEPSVLAMIPPGRGVRFQQGPLPAHDAGGARLYGYVAGGYWRDVGDLLEYRLAHQDILAGVVTVKMAGHRVEGLDKAIWLGEGSRVDFTAGLKGSVLIGKNVRVGANARISNSVIGDGCVIEDRAVVLRLRALGQRQHRHRGGVDRERGGPGQRGQGACASLRGGAGQRRLLHRRGVGGQGRRQGLAPETGGGRRDPVHQSGLGGPVGALALRGLRHHGSWATWRSRRSSPPSWGRPSAPPSGSTPSSAPAGTRIGPVGSSIGP